MESEAEPTTASREERGTPRERARDALRIAVALLFVTSFAVLDVVLRFDAYRAHPALVLDAASSVALWAFLLVIFRRTRLSVVLFFVHAVAFLLVAACARYYRVPLDTQMAETGRHAWVDVRPMVMRTLPVFAIATLAMTAFVTWALRPTRSDVPRRPRPVPPLLLPRWVPLLALPLGLFGSAPGRASPDLRLAAALPTLVRKEPPRLRVGGAYLPPLPSRRPRLPNVLLVLGESLRADEVCSVHGPGCETFAKTDALFPNRIGFTNARSVASYTAVSLSALLTGRTQEGPREPLLAAPNIFDVVGAVRRGDARPTVMYASSQLEDVFEGKDARAQVDVFVSAENLLGRHVDDLDQVLSEDLDGRLVDVLEKRLPTLPEPFFLFVHLIGTHAPYFEDPTIKPYLPASHVVSFGNLEELHNAYRNAIVATDVRLARIVTAFLARSGDSPRVVLFTSDHAEAFGERSAIHHGQNLHDEQIHVPFFIDVAAGAMTPDEIARLEGRKARAITHLDVLPTLIDVYGVEDAIRAGSAGGLRARTDRDARRDSGRSLLAAEFPLLEPLAITNCTGMFPCPVNTWGMLDEDHKMVMQAWDGEWRCMGLVPREHEIVPWDPPCDRLREASRLVYEKKPNGMGNR